MILKNGILSFIMANSEKEFNPYYIYDIQQIRDNCRIFQDITYPNKAIHFASMANLNPQFLNIVMQEGLNVFVNSVLHLNMVLDAGFSNRQIIFTASALPEKTMRLAHDCGVQLNLDSPNQLALWMRLFPEEKVGIRCNIGDGVLPYSTHAGFFIGSKSRLGFTKEEIDGITDKTAINGLHLYAGTDIYNADYLINCYRELIDISEIFPNLEFLNFGGGFGIPEKGEDGLDMQLYNNRLTHLMNEVSQHRNSSIRLILEPGRIIGGQAGYFVCNVTDIKMRDANRLVGLNASTVQFSRPLMYPEIASHPVLVIRDGAILNSENTFITTIYGCSTFSRDLFSKNIVLPEIRIGDIVVFGHAGSYSASAHSQFLGFPEPGEYFI